MTEHGCLALGTHPSAKPGVSVITLVPVNIAVMTQHGCDVTTDMHVIGISPRPALGAYLASSRLI